MTNERIFFMDIAIITGASSGLGREFIIQLKNEGIDEIWAVARRKDRLNELSNLTHIKIRPVSLDLTLKESMELFKEMLEDEKPHVSILINAAGFGKIGSYNEIDIEDIDNMIELNCRTAVDITLMCLPYMTKGDRILEVCSTAAFQPFQFLGVYAASKAFLYRFSRALYIELMPRKISVTAVCPYWIKDTEFIPTAQTENSSVKVRHFPLASHKRSVARLALNDSRLRLPVSTPGIMCSLHRIAAKFIPSCIMCLIWAGIRRL